VRLHREAAQRIAATLVMIGGGVFVFSLVVALAFAGVLGPAGPWFGVYEFRQWVAGFELALGSLGISLVVLLIARIDDDVHPAPLSPQVATPSACPSCGADLGDLVEAGGDRFPDCPNCGEDLMAAAEAGAESAAPHHDVSPASGS
jgi:hypothetical protein